MAAQSKNPPEVTKTARSLIESSQFKTAVANILPHHLTPDRFVRIAISAMTRVPKLAECDPNTVLQCLMTLSQFGLEPDGRNAHLIPFWNSQKKAYDCQLIIDYKGLAALAKRSGQVSYVHADAVCEQDAFEFNKGVVVKHEVDFKKDRGKPYAYYSMVRYKDGTEQADCMTRAEVDRIRARSRAKDSGPWVTDYDEMAKKTVFRRLSKWLELSPEFRDALDADADALEELRFEQAIPIQRPKIRKLKDREGEDFGKPAEDLESGSEITSGAGVVDTGLGEKPETSPEPTGAADVAPSAAPPKTKLKIRERTAGENESAVLKRLDSMRRSKEDLVRVCIALEALTPDEGWSEIGEAGFGKILHPDNWKIIEEKLVWPSELT